MTRSAASRGWMTFTVVWLGQTVSLVGSGLTSFALGVWVFERTGSTTQFALIGLFSVLPRVLFSPLAGTVVDRWNRRWIMIVSDTCAGLCTLVMALLLFSNRLETWHIYLLVAASSAFGTVQWPAYAASTTLLIPKQDLGHANGMVQLGRAASEVLAPALAGVLVQTLQLQGVILIDLTTFVFAVIMLLLVRFPGLQHSVTGGTERGSFQQELVSGWKYIAARQGLMGLLAFSIAVSFLWGMVGALIAPMILGFLSSDGLGIVVSIAGAGMLTGSLLMGIWGGPRRRINGVLGCECLSGICFLLMGLRPSLWLTAIGAFGAHVTIAIVSGSDQAIWQCKVTPGVQGRVFAAQHMIASAAKPLAYLLAGPLADGVFEPLLASGGPLAESAGRIVGTGAGRGIGLLFLVLGLVKMVVPAIGYASARVRLVEDELPDAIGVA